ncbi:hypothetical protein VNO78_35185 [Psophocarpus tetragonolobus]|uniref:Uncharacterized protein n=1 Tax=Psophocarpus tetragonolobus TaxID=3891 RepID=A0AAN9NDJ3_PSOTE
MLQNREPPRDCRRELAYKKKIGRKDELSLKLLGNKSLIRLIFTLSSKNSNESISQALLTLLFVRLRKEASRHRTFPAIELQSFAQPVELDFFSSPSSSLTAFEM